MMRWKAGWPRSARSWLVWTALFVGLAWIGTVGTSAGSSRVDACSVRIYQRLVRDPASVGCQFELPMVESLLDAVRRDSLLTLEDAALCAQMRAEVRALLAAAAVDPAGLEEIAVSSPALLPSAVAARYQGQVGVSLLSLAMIRGLARGAGGEILLPWPSQGEAGRTARMGFAGLVVRRPTGPDGHWLVAEAMPHTSAASAGVVPGDVLLAVDGIAVAELLHNPESLLWGEPNSTVRVTVAHEGLVREVSLVRQPLLRNPNEVHVREGAVAWLRPRVLGPEQVASLAGELERVRGKGVRAVVLDLRSTLLVTNQGVAAWAGMFVRPPGRPMLLFRGRGRTETLRAPLVPPCALPVVVLVNECTHGPAEMLAAVLRECAGVPVVGVRTATLGPEEGLCQLSNGCLVGIPTFRAETPRGVALEGMALAPDVEVPMPLARAFGGADAQLDKACEVARQRARPGRKRSRTGLEHESWKPSPGGAAKEGGH